jgi:hypothetical protein
MTQPSPGHPPAPQQRVFGTPAGALMSAGGALHRQRAHQGRLGEERLAALTRQVVEQSPAMLLFHSVKLPGETGDIDQLLYAAGTFYLMDAKLWKGFVGQSRVTYDVAMRDSETLVFVRDGQPFAGGQVKAPKQLTAWRHHLRHQRVRAVVVLMDPGAQVGLGASSDDVLVIGALDLQAWLQSLAVAPSPHLAPACVAALADLTFDSARPATHDHHQRHRPRPPATRPPAIQHLPSSHDWSTIHGTSASMVPLPLPALGPRPPISPEGRAHYERLRSRARGALWCVPLAWVAWLVSMALPLLSWIGLPVSLALAVTAIALGASSRRRLAEIAVKSNAAAWAIGLAITHLATGFLVPVSVSLAFMALSSR